jgi:hypothetical protein
MKRTPTNKEIGRMNFATSQGTPIGSSDMMIPSMITDSVDDVEQAEEMSRVHESVDSNPVRLAVTGVRNADPAVQSYVMRKKEWRRLINQAEHVCLHTALMEHHYSLS